jgi:excisionase family DNA binding protein
MAAITLPEDDTMTVAQAARELEVSVGTIYALCRDGRLGHLRIGLGRGTIRIEESDIESFRRESRVAASSRPAADNHVELRHIKIRRA